MRVSRSWHFHGPRPARGRIENVGIDDVAMEEWERGWHSSDKVICADCVSDKHLKAAVTAAAVDASSCSFCGSSPASDFDVLMEAFMVGVRNTFEQADDAGMPWDGGYVFQTYDHWDLPDWFVDVGAGDHEDAVVDEIRDHLVEKTYASRWWLALEPHAAYSSAWKEFRQQILHRTRFVFWADQSSPGDHEGAGEISVSGILHAIGKLLVHFQLITAIPGGTFTYRARGHAEEIDSQIWGAADLGTNKPEKSTGSTRMSPAGIPLFYGADDVDTALAEVAHADMRQFFTVGRFVTTAPIKVVDLTQVSAVPSIFDPEMGHWQGHLHFLNDLVEELRQPIDQARSNLDYVPTQVFCEYLLRVFDDRDIQGVVWMSAAVDGVRCVALDIPQEDCVDPTAAPADRPQLQLIADGKTVYRRRTNEFRAL
jgi:hypothetical protein